MKNESFYTYRAVWLLTIVALVYTAVFLVKSGEPEALWWWPWALAFFVWGTAPYLVTGWYAYRLKQSPWAIRAVLVANLLMAATGFWLNWNAFVSHPDPQSGLISIFLPPVQLVIAVIGVGTVALIKRIASA